MWKMEIEGVQGSGSGIASEAASAAAAIVPPQGGVPGAGQNESDKFSLIFDEGYCEVLKRILEYLSVEEMKALSSVSRVALGAVRRSKCFSDRIEFRIREKTLESGMLENCSFPWKRLSICVPTRDGVLETLTSLQFLESVESLVFVAFYRGAESTDRHKYSAEILRRTKSLVVLKTEYLSFKYLLTKVSSTPELIKVISNIRCLEIRCNFFDTLFVTEFPRLKFNLKALNVDRIPNQNFNKFVLKMLEQSKDTLENLNLDRALWYGDRWGQICCKKLRKVTLSNIAVEGVGELEMFLRNQPALEKITVETDSPSRLLCCLEERASKLRKLHIKILAIEKKEESAPEFLDRKIVARMKALEDFHVELDSSKCRKSAVANIEEILGGLPTIKLKHLFIHGIDTDDTTNCLSRKVGPLLSRFKNLTKLDLFSLQSLDDAGLQKIIKTCRNLAILTLIDLPKITGYGISGVGRGAKDTVALNNLKDLMTLSILWCHEVTLDSILSVTRFDLLRTLELNYHFTDWGTVKPRGFVFQILAQNPSLRYLDFRVYGDDNSHIHDLKLELEAKKLFPQILSLHIYHDYYVDEDDDSASDGNDCTRSKTEEDDSTGSDFEKESAAGKNSERHSSIESNPDWKDSTGSDSHSGDESIDDSNSENGSKGFLG